MSRLGDYGRDGDLHTVTVIEHDDHGLVILDEDEHPGSWLRQPVFSKRPSDGTPEPATYPAGSPSSHMRAPETDSRRGAQGGTR